MARRAETKQLTREALILAGMELFRELGLDGPSLDAICERAGKTRGAFYVHFADRDAFEVAVMERIIGAYLATIVKTADPAGDLIRTVQQFIDQVVMIASGKASSPIGVLGSDQLRLLLQGLHRSAQVRERFAELLRFAELQLIAVISAAQAGGQVRKDIVPDALAHVLIGQVFGLMAVLEATQLNVEQVERTRDAVLALLRPPG
jgi:TetR/AcrR family transcriptional regulator, transcriptional repressor for nem operon